MTSFRYAMCCFAALSLLSVGCSSLESDGGQQKAGQLLRIEGSMI